MLGPVDDQTAFAPDRGWIPYQQAAGVVALVVLGLPLLGLAWLLWLQGGSAQRALAILLALAVLGGGALGLILPPLRWRATRYRLGPDALELRTGVLWRSVTMVPHSRIQHIDVQSGPLQRAFGIATLVVHTPGTRFAAVPLPGLTQLRAEALRDRLLPRHGHG